MKLTIKKLTIKSPADDSVETEGFFSFFVSFSGHLSLLIIVKGRGSTH